MRAVSNESSSIVRNLGQLQLPGCHDIDLCPPQLLNQIEQLNDQVRGALDGDPGRGGEWPTLGAQGWTLVGQCELV